MSGVGKIFNLVKCIYGEILTLFLALIVSGAYDYPNSRSVEAIGEDGSSNCSLPDLPGRRRYHTQTGLEICGGQFNPNSCLSLTSAGVWEVTRNLSQPRVKHSSWMSPSGLVLMGGHDSESRGTAELVTEQGSSILFQMKYQTTYACIVYCPLINILLKM